MERPPLQDSVLEEEDKHLIEVQETELAPVGMERSRPPVYTPPTPEELRQAKESFQARLKERDDRVEAINAPLFKEHCEERTSAGNSIRLVEGLGELQFPRLDGQIEYLAKLFAKQPRYMRPLENANRRTTKSEANPYIPNRVTKEGSCSMFFPDGHMIWAKEENWLNELYRGTDRAPLQKYMEECENRLQKVYPIKPHEDSRHPKTAYHTGLLKHCASIGKPIGVRHLGHWPATGHQRDPWHETAGPWNQIPTSDLQGGAKKNEEHAEAAKRFMEEMVPVSDAVGGALKATLPDVWANQRSHLEVLAAAGHGGPEILGDLHCSTLMVQVVESPSDEHRDPDAPGGYAVWTVHGSDYAGADIVIGPPGQKERVRLLPGDIFIAKACEEWHLVTPIIGGHRVATVYTSKSNADTVVQNFKYMTPAELEVAKAQKAEKEERTRQENEVGHAKEAELVEAWKKVDRKTSKQDSFRLDYIPHDPKRLEKAGVKKNKQMRQADSAKKAEIEKMPASLFYAFNSTEQKRIAKDANPFKAMNPANVLSNLQDSPPSPEDRPQKRRKKNLKDTSPQTRNELP